MEEKDFGRIEEMMSRMMGQFQSETRQEMRQFKDEIIGKFDRAIGTTEDNLQRKLELLVEGQQMLAEKLEDTRSELKAQSAKVDQRVTAVAADLAAHRRDTEAHHRGYRVREE